MSSSAQLVVNTLTLGAVYALIAVGFVILFRATKVLSFAQGAFMVLGGLLFKTFTDQGLDLWAALVLALAATFAVGALTYRVVFARIIGSEPFVTAMATIGLSTVYVAVAVMIWGATQITLPADVISGELWHVGPFRIQPAGVFAIVVALVTFALLLIGLQRTRIGLRMRAVADDARLAGQAGINTVKISMASWGLAAAAAAAGAAAYLLSSVSTPASLQDVGLLAFPAILLGGLDSILGALVGGLAIAFIQTLTATYWSGSLQDVAAYVVLMLVLLARPSGLFGRPDAARL